MPNSSEIKEWYNSFTLKQRKIGTNLRHFTIFNKAVKAGLRKSHNVLEIGCGIGTLTGLLHNYISKGKLVATDISDESVRIAKTTLSKSDKIEFIVTDMIDFTHELKFDFIILPDVLEHIPLENHEALFQTLSKILSDSGQVLINIPHPRYLNYVREHEPEKLQIVDQAIPADHLMSVAYDVNLTLESYESHTLFNHGHDYAFIRFSKFTQPSFQPVDKLTVIRRKTVARIKRQVAMLFQ